MKRLLIISGLLAAIGFLAGSLLAMNHSQLTDFIQFISWAVFILLFLPSFFIVKAHAISTHEFGKKLFRFIRYAILLGIVFFLYTVFWPRQYGSLELLQRQEVQYWELSTGSRIAYTLIPGKGSKRPDPIIFLAGGPGGSIGESDIRRLSFLSEDGYDVYLYDMVGCGFSSRLKNIQEYTADRHKRDLEEMVKKIGSPKVILLGQSWGAILAVLFAADNPGRLEKMIFTGPGPIQPVHRELGNLKAPDSLHLRKPYYSNRQGNDQANNIRTRAMAFCALQFGIKLASDKEADDFAAYWNTEVDRSVVCDTANSKRSQPRIGAGFYVQIMTVASFNRTRDPRPNLKNSPIPVLVMKGQCDNQLWGFTHEYLDIFPNHQLAVIPAAGHAISLEQPELYKATIRGFLNRY